jgi:hypothetical protein
VVFAGTAKTAGKGFAVRITYQTWDYEKVLDRYTGSGISSLQQ